METDKTIIVGNWKMYGHLEINEGLLAAIASVSDKDGIEVIVCPPAILIPAAVGTLKGTKVQVGGQDCHSQPEGAFTGNISAPMLKQAGCSHVIVGHSERRQYHLETNIDVAQKAAQAQAAGLIPIICIGETAGEREAGTAEAVVEKQLLESIPAQKGDFLLAYEPVWAIGSGKTPTAVDIQQMHSHITRVVADKYGVQPAVLYGGSVKAQNAGNILATEGVSGVLVGGASLKVDEFCGIIAAAAGLKKG